MRPDGKRKEKWWSEAAVCSPWHTARLEVFHSFYIAATFFVSSAHNSI